MSKLVVFYFQDSIMEASHVVVDAEDITILEDGRFDVNGIDILSLFPQEANGFFLDAHKKTFVDGTFFSRERFFEAVKAGEFDMFPCGEIRKACKALEFPSCYQGIVVKNWSIFTLNFSDHLFDSHSRKYIF